MTRREVFFDLVIPAVCCLIVLLQMFLGHWEWAVVTALGLIYIELCSIGRTRRLR